MTESVQNPVLARTLFLNAFRRFGPRPAIVADGRTWTYAEIGGNANRLANALIAQGVRPGERVAVMTSNCAEYVIAHQGVMRAGAALVSLNDLLSDDERRFILRDSNAKVAVASRSQVHAAVEVREEGGDLQRVVFVEDAGEVPDGTVSWNEYIARFPDSLPEVAVTPDTVVRIGYTGGTTGSPKGALHTQHTYGVNQLAHLCEMELTDDDVLLLTSPLPHAAGALLAAALLKGNLSYIERGFDLDVVLNRVEREGASFLFMVPTMIYRLLDRLAVEPRDLPRLKTILYGAAPITVDQLRQGLDLLGPVFMQLYGQTECPNWITRLTKRDHQVTPERVHLLKSTGLPCPLTQVRIVDGDDNEVPAGTAGEIVVRSPYQMVGYHGRSETSATTLRGGWLHTGDVGRMDEEGYVYLVDRKNDMIISGGMNVYSTTVENAIAGQEGVSQVAVVGVEHPDWGEAVVAYVVPTGGAEIDPGRIIERARVHLAKYEVPKAVVQAESLPLTSIGKVDKKQLREAWAGWEHA